LNPQLNLALQGLISPLERGIAPPDSGKE